MRSRCSASAAPLAARAQHLLDPPGKALLITLQRGQQATALLQLAGRRQLFQPTEPRSAGVRARPADASARQPLHGFEPLVLLSTELQLPDAITTERHAAQADQQRQGCQGRRRWRQAWMGRAWRALRVSQARSRGRLAGGVAAVLSWNLLRSRFHPCIRKRPPRFPAGRQQGRSPAPRQSTIRLAPSCRAISATRGLGTNKGSSQFGPGIGCQLMQRQQTLPTADHQAVEPFRPNDLRQRSGG